MPCHAMPCHNIVSKLTGFAEALLQLLNTTSFRSAGLVFYVVLLRVQVSMLEIPTAVTAAPAPAPAPRPLHQTKSSRRILFLT